MKRIKEQIARVTLGQNVSLVLRSLTVGVCTFAALSGQPPAQAQAPSIPSLSSEDAVQDSNIAALNQHLDNTDRTVVQQSRDIQNTASEVSEMQGEQRVFFAVLGVLTGGSIVFQIRVKRP